MIRFLKIYLFLPLILTASVPASTEKERVSFLNEQEKSWLSHLEVPLRVGITKIPNQVLKRDNRYEGFSIDIFKRIELLLSIKFEYVYFKTWDELIIAGKRREIDIIFSAQKTEDRLAYYDFTDPILRQKNKIIVSLNKSTELSIEDLFGKKVALVSGSAIFEYLKFNYPEVILVSTTCEEEALGLVSKSRVNAAISEVIRAGYYIKKSRNTNLHIAGDIKYDYNLRIASRNDVPMLSVILSKAVEVIPMKYIETLQLKWGYIKETDHELLWKVIIGFLIILSLITLWIVLLKREKRIRELILFHQSRLAQIGESINMIAHQWRQPLHTLNALVMVMDIKMSKQESSLNNLLEEEFFEIETTTGYMSQTINDFRDFFKPQAKKERFEIKKSVENAVRLLKPLFEYDEIIIHENYEDDIWLLGYSNEIGQVIINILNNAKDALLSNNLNKEKHIYLSTYTENKRIIISIEDNASGINNEIIYKVFNPYFSTKSNTKGTGLGLYISKMIVEDHMNGDVFVENSDIGARFTIVFNSEKI